MMKKESRCLHKGEKNETWVTFKNNTKHIALHCSLCGTHCGYKKQKGNSLIFSPYRSPDLIYDDQEELRELQLL